MKNGPQDIYGDFFPCECFYSIYTVALKNNICKVLTICVWLG